MPVLVTITCAWDVAVGTEDADDGGGAAGAAGATSGLLVLDRTKFLAVNKVFITMYMLQIAPTNAKACNKTKYLLPMSMQLADTGTCKATALQVSAPIVVTRDARANATMLRPVQPFGTCVITSANGEQQEQQQQQQRPRQQQQPAHQHLKLSSSNSSQQQPAAASSSSSSSSSSISSSFDMSAP